MGIRNNKDIETIIQRSDVPEVIPEQMEGRLTRKDSNKVDLDSQDSTEDIKDDPWGIGQWKIYVYSIKKRRVLG